MLILQLNYHTTLGRLKGIPRSLQDYRIIGQLIRFIHLSLRRSGLQTGQELLHQPIHNGPVAGGGVKFEQRPDMVALQVAEEAIGVGHGVLRGKKGAKRLPAMQAAAMVVVMPIEVEHGPYLAAEHAFQATGIAMVLALDD